MIAPNSNPVCKEAELYHYDFLLGESRESIPQSIIDHIKWCEHCQRQLNQLKDVLSQSESNIELEQHQAHSAVTAILKLHFAYIGKPVTCSVARPFLPALLDPAIEIRIPTPITVHLDNCQQCSEDLETIRKLNLNTKQLCRLSQLFAEKPGEDNVSCSRAQAAILAVVSMAFHETSQEVLKHLSTCPNCRKVLYEFRNTVRREYQEAVRDKIDQKAFPCEEVMTSDIFDYVVPYGVDPVNDQYAKFRESLTSHLRTCPTCLAAMQRLHETLYGIVEQAESVVITVCRIDESAKAQASGESDDLYAGFPIKVEVIRRQDESKIENLGETVSRTTGLKQKAPTVNLKLLAKTGLAAAAVILVAVALFFTTRTAKAVTIDQIYKALEKVKNVYIASFVPGKAEPTHEKWVSRTLNVYMTRTERQLVIWDIANKLRKTEDLETAVTETIPLTRTLITTINKEITGVLGLMPFSAISEIPRNAEWNRVTNEEIKDTPKGIEVYDLTWLDKAYDGSILFKKHRVFVHPETNLPQRTEFYQKLADDDKYILRSVHVVKYLENNEITAIVKGASL
jgi:hypothetical protein